jgi:NAD(P)-dependent dehydrogenase (short-subunit alcohol dehydrogenase family)
MSAETVVLITGCSTGFGRVTATTLARAKCRVFAGMRDIRGRNAANAAEVRSLAEKQSLALSVVELDVTDDASVDRAITEVIGAAGHIDVLVNNAGLTVRGLVEAVNLEQTRRIFETNVFAVQRMNRAVLPHMRQRGSGLLVHISSQAGRVVLPGLGMYSASKAGLEALVESYHYELAGLGIDSILVQPGAFATAIGQNADKAADESREASYGAGSEIPKTLMTNLGTRQDPQQVADAILRLVEMPAGKRPLRTDVGVTSDFVARLNAFTIEIQRGILDTFGLTSLIKFQSRAES